MSKHIHDNDLLPFFKRFLRLLKELEQQEEFEYIYISLSYAIEAGEVSNKQEFFNTIRSLESIDKEKIMTIAEQLRQEGYRQAIEQNKEIMMTIAEQLRKEGRLEGLQEGHLEGKAEGKIEGIEQVARQMLTENLPLGMIAKVTGISIQDLRDLKHKSAITPC